MKKILETRRETVGEILRKIIFNEKKYEDFAKILYFQKIFKKILKKWTFREIFRKFKKNFHETIKKN